MEERYLQLAIFGIAEDKELNDAPGLPTPEIRRKKLAEYIVNGIRTNKVGFAKMAAVSPATVTKWLNTDAVPGIDVAKRLSDTLRLPLEQVCDWFTE